MRETEVMERSEEWWAQEKRAEDGREEGSSRAAMEELGRRKHENK